MEQIIKELKISRNDSVISVIFPCTACKCNKSVQNSKGKCNRKKCEIKEDIIQTAKEHDIELSKKDMDIYPNGVTEICINDERVSTDLFTKELQRVYLVYNRKKAADKIKWINTFTK